jgi:REP element-mobilizing transposase RayT
LGGDEKTLVVEVLRHFEDERYTLPAHVVMDDHVHVLVFPLEGYALHRIVHSWKSFSAKQLAKASGRTAPVWQREYLDRIVRSD